jgi:hypothetical protein
VRVRIGLLFVIALGVLASGAAPAAQSPAGSACDRPCLDRLADQFVQGLLVNDASRLPRADGFRYTENGQPLQIGDGLWGTLTAYAGLDPALAPAAAELRYRLTIADPGVGEVVRMTATDENGTKGMLVLRLKVAGGKIGEAEALAVREEFPGERAGTVALFQPRLLVMLDGAEIGEPDPLLVSDGSGGSDRAAMVRAANAYFDGIERGSARAIPFAPNCTRRENGVRLTGDVAAPPLDPRQPKFRPFALGCAGLIDSGFYSYVGRIRDRRYVADPARGLLFAFAMIDHPGTTLSFKAKGVGTVVYPGPRGHPGEQATSQFGVGNLGGANMIAPTAAHSASVFRFVDGRIAHIDSFARPGPFGLRSGWQPQ